MGNAVMRFEIGCKDDAETIAFYQKAFDWSAQKNDHGAEITTGADKGVHGAITALGHEPHQYVMFYMEVADADATCEKIRTQGGEITIGPRDIPGGKGRFAWFKDPEGNALGIFQPPK